MNKKIYLFIIFFLISGCSLNKNSEFWTSSKKIVLEKGFDEVLKDKDVIKKEFNSNIKLKLEKVFNVNSNKSLLLNNPGRSNFDSKLKKISKYKFSKIGNFHQYEPEILFYENRVTFFENKGTILQFDKNSKLIWKKNYYTKTEKKLNPILQFANNNKYVVIADNIAKIYLLDLKSGNLIWSKNNTAPFNSQIKIYKDKFFVIDFSNTLRCYSLKDGKELWNIKTENALIRSQKKLSMVIYQDKIYFNNSIGDITAVDINIGDILWQLPTQSSEIYESAFSLETSEIVSDGKSLFFSNNRNEFFSVDMKSGNFRWKNNINANVRPITIDKLLFTVSIDGYLIILEKDTGNIIRITDVFDKFKLKKRPKINPTGFIIGSNKIYLSTNNGRLLIIDLSDGRTESVLKIDNEKISSPLIIEKSLFVTKDNSVIKLN